MKHNSTTWYFIDKEKQYIYSVVAYNIVFCNSDWVRLDNCDTMMLTLRYCTNFVGGKL